MKKDSNTEGGFCVEDQRFTRSLCIHILFCVVEKSLNIAAATFVAMVLHICTVAMTDLING